MKVLFLFLFTFSYASAFELVQWNGMLESHQGKKNSSIHKPQAFSAGTVLKSGRNAWAVFKDQKNEFKLMSESSLEWKNHLKFHSGRLFVRSQKTHEIELSKNNKISPHAQSLFLFETPKNDQIRVTCLSGTGEVLAKKNKIKMIAGDQISFHKDVSDPFPRNIPKKELELYIEEIGTSTLDLQ